MQPGRVTSRAVGHCVAGRQRTRGGGSAATTLRRMAKAPVLTPQGEDFPRWYQDVIAKAELAENGPARGTMVIRPYGFSLWERLQAAMDDRIKAAYLGGDL